MENQKVIYTHRTRSGLKARIIASNIAGNLPIVAAILHDDGIERIVQMHKDLTINLNLNYLSPFDLIEYNHWEDVKVDTPILVYNDLIKSWVKKHFAKYEDGKVYVWYDGKTSWTSDGEYHCSYWPQARLADDKEML